MKSSNKQMHTYIYIYIHMYHPKTVILVELQKKVCHQKRKIYIRNSRKAKLYMYKAEEWIILRVPDFPKNIGSIIFHPYTLHIFVVDKSFFSSWLLLSSFLFFQLKMRAIGPKFLKSNGGHRPQPILLTFLDWSNGLRWYKSACAHMPQTT